MARRVPPFWARRNPSPASTRVGSRRPSNLLWQYKGPPCDHYQREHDLLFDAIRQDKPWNETERCAKAAMTGILGRMAAESGKTIYWDEAIASNLELAPGLDRMTMDSPPPVTPDAQGRYPVAMPGETRRAIGEATRHGRSAIRGSPKPRIDPGRRRSHGTDQPTLRR